MEKEIPLIMPERIVTTGDSVASKGRVVKPKDGRMTITWQEKSGIRLSWREKGVDYACIKREKR